MKMFEIAFDHTVDYDLKLPHRQLHSLLRDANPLTLSDAPCPSACSALRL